MVLSNMKIEVLFKVNNFYLPFFYGTKMSSNPLHGKQIPIFSSCNGACRPVAELVTTAATAAANAESPPPAWELRSPALNSPLK